MFFLFCFVLFCFVVVVFFWGGGGGGLRIPEKKNGPPCVVPGALIDYGSSWHKTANFNF